VGAGSGIQYNTVHEHDNNHNHNDDNRACNDHYDHRFHETGGRSFDHPTGYRYCC
jgi:hypothetical protein